MNPKHTPPHKVSTIHKSSGYFENTAALVRLYTPYIDTPTNANGIKRFFLYPSLNGMHI